ncbi:SWIM zinc finger family protein [Amycolatopsis sp. H6(2020)]|nr:SWIM zinc finger family protein [Amycolatopsis sp. H6(2020)]
MAVIRVDKSSVRKLADSSSFERGQQYFASGRVRRVRIDGTTVSATVEGTYVYRVKLEVARSGLRGRCSCPYGGDGVFCKHCVATALAWLEQGGQLDEPDRRQRSDEQLRSFLLERDHAWLVDQLMAAARSDAVLRARLDVAAGADPSAVFDDRELRDQLERAIEIADYVDYGAAYGYFQHVGAALEAVGRLIDGGFPDAAITLSEYALELLEDSGERIDDSDGGLGEAIARAEEIHLAACEAGSPDVVALAERLVGRALGSEYEVFLEALPAYQDVLGDRGLARYRELVEQATRKPGPNRSFTVKYLSERLAECLDGTDGLVDVLAKNVTSGYDILRIAELLCTDDRDAEALTWLERGLSEFEPDNRLRDLAAEIHLRAGRRDLAAEMRWANFAEHPTLDSYLALRDTAPSDFPAWRERALTLLAGERPAETPWWPGRSTLVEILLAEKEIDAAWQAATEGGCAEDLWLRLARERAKKHPADAIPVLLRTADAAIAGANRDAYRTGAQLLAEAKKLFARCGREQEFAEHLAALRHRHRARWALREELDRARLP